MKILFVTDLDGTFVKDSVSVNPRDLDAYKKIEHLGDFSVATGRSKREIEYIRDKYDLQIKHYIGLNGATISTDSKIIKNEIIDKKELFLILDYFKKNNIVFDALDGKERIGNFNYEKKERLWNMPLTCVEDPFSILIKRSIYKINVRPQKGETKHILSDLIYNFKDLAIYQSGETRIEITEHNISKASAVKEIRSNYDRVIVMGDSGNDVDMFKVADISYCMASAPKEVKEYADYIVEDFAEAVEHYVSNY